MNKEIEFMPDRLNEEPVVFLAMTNSEIKIALLTLFATWTPVCFVVGLMVGKLLLSLTAVAGLVFASMWIVGKRLKVIKRGKPKQYHVLAINAWLEDRGLSKETLIRTNRVWDIKRRSAK